MLCYVMLYNTLCYVMLCYITHDMLCYVMTSKLYLILMQL